MRFLARLSPELAASFTAEQLEAIRLAFGMRYATQHALDLRRTLHLPWGRYYVVLLVGRTQRREAPGGGWLARAGRGLVDTLGVIGMVAGIAAMLMVAGQSIGVMLPEPDAMVLADR